MSGFVSSNIITLFPYAAFAAFAVGMAVVALFNGWQRRDVRSFSVLLFLQAAWTVVFVMELYSSAPEAKLFWDAIHWPLLAAVDAGYLMFALEYVKAEEERTPPTILAALYVPVGIAVAAAIAAVLGAESVLYRDVDRIGLPFSEFRYGPSALAIGLFAYGYLQVAAACVVLARHNLAARADRRKGAAYVLAGLGSLFLLDGVGSLVTMSFGSGLSPPLWAALCDVLLAYSLFSERLFGSLTKARRAVMDTLLDPVFVLGKGEDVVDCNAAARTLLGARGDKLIGTSARELFASWPSSVTAALDFPEAETELDLPDRDGIPRRSYRITVASNSSKDRSGAWKLLVFNDITGQKSDARDMAATNEELEFWVRQRTSALRLEVAQRTAAEERLRELNEEMAKTQREILWTLSEVVESRSRETAYHVVRVGEYARILSQGYGMSAEEVEIVTAAAPMHDVGKIAIPDAILSKPGALTDEERDVMKRHTIVGKEILGSSQRPLLRAAAVIAFEHHERWDGKGYPSGTAGGAISLSGRIVSLCDVFDALYTKRVYKDAWPLERVLGLFREESGKAFEPRLVDIFLERIDDILDITKRFEDLPPVPAL